ALVDTSVARLSDARPARTSTVRVLTRRPSTQRRGLWPSFLFARRMHQRAAFIADPHLGTQVAHARAMKLSLIAISSTARSVFVLAFLTVGCTDVVEDKTSANAGESDLTMAELPIRLNDITGGMFDQQIDHSEGGAQLGTFKQRYWYSRQFA